MNRIYLEYKDTSCSSERLRVEAAGHLYLVLRDDEVTPTWPNRVRRGRDRA